MNVSYNWLKEYVDFDLSPEETSKALTSLGLEVESVEEVETIKGGLKGLVIGKVLTCEDHQDSDHLHVTTVDLGKELGVQQIVCGAPNVRAGLHVVVATIGTTLYNGEEEFKIKKSKIRGVESFGMICSAPEIGVGTSHEGIIELPTDTTIGTAAAEYYNIKSDYLIEVDITPNRVESASHYGVARDLASYLKQNKHKYQLNKPQVTELTSDKSIKGIEVVVEDTEACPRYAGVTIKGVKVTESPEWLKEKLQTIGLRSINNVVDITNFVLHELGHPLHAFDVAKIKGKKVIVKKAKAGEKFVTLDEVERTLNEADLMICNTEAPMCIAGVFGGLDSGVTEKTTDVFLECAYFQPMSVRKTARRQGLNTDSSFRFERGVDPNDTLYILNRAASLILEVAGGKIVGDIQDHYPNPIKNIEIELSYTKVSKTIGKDLSKETVKSILDSLEIQILKETEDILTISIPTYRVDVTRDVDVIEDILRIYGYNNVEIHDAVKSNLSYITPTDKSYDAQDLISTQLTGAGFNEILNNSLTHEEYYAESTTFPLKNGVKLINAISSDLNVMRQTLLFGGLESIAYNVNRKIADLHFYEFGNCYQFDESKKGEGILDEYSEDFKLALWITGNNRTNSWLTKAEKTSVFELKAYVENILQRLGLAGKYTFEQSSNELLSQAIIIKVNNKEVGILGTVAKKVLKSFDISNEVYFAELSWDALMKANRKHQVTFSEISKYPSVERDFALLLDKKVTFKQIEELAYKADKKLLKDVRLFDVYEGENLPEGKKSYAVKFIVQDEEKTLNDKQIDALMAKIKKTLEEQLGAQLR